MWSKWIRDAQREVIISLIQNGADPNATDKSGVAALHPAVRDRRSMAVGALIENGREPRLMNKQLGPTAPRCPEHWQEQFRLGRCQERTTPNHLLAPQHGASPGDIDANGKTVADTHRAIESTDSSPNFQFWLSTSNVTVEEQLADTVRSDNYGYTCELAEVSNSAGGLGPRPLVH